MDLAASQRKADMSIWRAIWRGSLARALFVSVSCTSTPAAACGTMSVADLASRLPRTEQFDVDPSLLPAFMHLWRLHRRDALPGQPDGVVVFGGRGQPLISAFRRSDCLLGVLPTAPEELWRTLREQIGPIA